jgi:hypothetical protein
MGFGSAAGPLTCEIVQVDEALGIMQVQFCQAVDQSLPARAMDSLFAVSQRRGDHVWAWALVEGADS